MASRTADTLPDTIPPPPGFRVSTRGRALIVHEEGEILHAYKDSLGYPTVCVGHLIRPGEKWAPVLTHAECDAVLERDVTPIERELTARVSVDLAECQVSCLASWMFNNGTGCIRGSQVLGAMLDGRMRDVPRLLEAWCMGRLKSGGPLVMLPYLLARRRREGAIFAEVFGVAEAPQGPPRSELSPYELAYLSSLQFDLAEGAYEDYRDERMAAFQARE